MIFFTKHARDKFEALRKHKINISEKQIVDVVVNPELIDRSRLPLLIAQRKLDQRRVLRVVYKKSDGLKDMRHKKVKISYDPEADVLMWELNNKPIDHAEEAGNVIVHFSKNRQPVLMELLEASKFLSRVRKMVTRKEERVLQPVS